MRVLLYLRKSSDEHQAESIDTQRAGGTAFAHRRGWTVIGEIIDEGESRAEFKKRRGLLQLVARSESKARDFDVVVARDESRIGAGNRALVMLDDIIAADVDVWYYTPEPHGEQVRLDSLEAVLVNTIKGYAAEKERAKTAERTRENHQRKAELGWHVGGKVYGYDNERIDDGNGKSHSEYRKNEVEAAFVLEIWEHFADNWSERAIAKDLNDRGVPAPEAGGHGAGSWSPNCIREIVRRDRYLGALIWGKVGSEYRGGTRVEFERKEAEQVIVQNDGLRIIPEELYERVQVRIAKMKARSGGRDGFKGRQPKYLLSGKAVSRCGACGGPMHVGNTKHGVRIIKGYYCAWHRERGDSVCKNALYRPMETVDKTFRDWVEENILNEQVIVSILKEIRQRLHDRAQSSTSDADLLEAEVARIDKEMKKLVMVAANLGEDDKPEELARSIEEKTRRRRELKARLEAMNIAPSVIDMEVQRLEVEARKQMDDFKAFLASEPGRARRVVNSLIDEPVKFTPEKTPEGMRYRLSARMSSKELFRIESDPDGI